MKNLLTILFAFSWLACFGQPDSSAFLSSYLESERLSETKLSGQWDLPDYDCELYELFTEWQNCEDCHGQSPCYTSPYGHDWVYAQWGDVNELLPVTTDLVFRYCPCGCDKTENEARICRTCGLHQTRVKTTGWKQIPKKSEYMQLVKKFKQ